MPVAYLSGPLTRPETLKEPERNWLPSQGTDTGPSSTRSKSLPLLHATWSLVTPRRLDLAVKHRFFLHLLGGDDKEAADLYDWHIWERSGHRMKAGLTTDVIKRNVADYRFCAADLLRSMERGFDPSHPIPIDPDGELLNGSHRLACAIALGIKGAPVELHSRPVWAPAWDAAWFLAHGMNLDDVARLETRLRLMAEWPQQ